MKYLITALTGTTPVPPDQAVELWEAAREWIGTRMIETRFGIMSIFADGSGAIAVVDAEKHEEVFDLLLSYPLYPFFRWEVKPLCEWEHAFTTIIEGYIRGAG